MNVSRQPFGREGYARSAARDWIQLLVGLFGFGVAAALMVRSTLGLGPWDAFHAGLHELTGISIGGASVLVGAVILGATVSLGERPRAGTLANMVLVGLFIDLLLPRIPTAPSAALGLMYYLTAILLVGVCSGMYIAPGLGKGPRDGLVLMVSRRRGVPVRRVRTLLELSALGLGWAMGGAIGIGTVLFALLAGPSMQWGLQLFGVETRPEPLAPPSPNPSPA